MKRQKEGTEKPGASADDRLAPWRGAPVERLPLASIETDTRFQPRNSELVSQRYRAREAERLAELVSDLRRALEASTDYDLTAIWVARITGRYFVVDGHHRLAAYRLAGRKLVPARVVETDERGALRASLETNIQDRAVAMHVDQRREACWQALAIDTERGTVRPPHSLRDYERRHGVARGTVANMVKMLPRVDPSELSPAAYNPATGWPRWRNVRGNGPDRGPWKRTADEKFERAVEKEMVRLGKLVDDDRDHLRALIEAARRLAHDARNESADDQQRRQEIAEAHSVLQELEGITDNTENPF